jgi:hypothetical protein
METAVAATEDTEITEKSISYAMNSMNSLGEAVEFQPILFLL